MYRTAALADYVPDAGFFVAELNKLPEIEMAKSTLDSWTETIRVMELL